jgi:hypothetical protein
MAKRQQGKKRSGARKAAKRAMKKVKHHGVLSAFVAAIGSAVTTALASQQVRSLIDEVIGSTVDNVTRVINSRKGRLGRGRHRDRDRETADGLAEANT